MPFTEMNKIGERRAATVTQTDSYYLAICLDR